MKHTNTNTELASLLDSLKDDGVSTIPWLEERTILLAPTGSHSYGTTTDTSDKDYKGICIPPIDYFLGLNSFNEYDKSGGQNFKNTKDDIDINILHINKFVKDAMLGVPNSLELLFMQPEVYLKLDDIGTELVENRHLFLSKEIYKKFSSYANSHKHKIIIKKSNFTGRQDLVQKYGYDTKFFMHCIRIQTTAIEILETGTYSTFRPNRDFLLDCKNGLYAMEDALNMMECFGKKMDEAYEACTVLPDKPDKERIDKLLIHLNRKALQL